MGMKAFLRRLSPVAGAACFLAGEALSFGSWNYGVGTYLENLDGFGDFDLVQAVVTDPADTAAVVAPSWEITQPATFPGTGTTGIPFSGSGSATYFATVNEAGMYGEQVQLFQRWFSAARDMQWRDNCAAGMDVGDLSKCCVFPVEDPNWRLRGGHQESILLVPDVRKFNDCHSMDTKNEVECVNGVGVVSGRQPEITELYLRKEQMTDILLAGANYNVTWFLRSSGQHEFPGLEGTQQDTFNNRLASMKIGFSYSPNGSGEPPVQNTHYLAGATVGYQPIGMGGCADVWTGCPIRLILQDQESYDPQHAVRRYLNDPTYGKDFYMPYTLSFCLGALANAPPSYVGPAVTCRSCAYPDDGMNLALCPTAKDTLGTGVLGIFLTTQGQTDDGLESSSTPKCPPDFGVPYSNCRAAASLYIDGMMLTAGEGSYLSPVFDSLSPDTVWTHVSWESLLNIDPGGPRTPVKFRYDVAQDGAELGAGDLGAALTPAAETGTISLTATSVGRYFRYQAGLVSWDMNTSNYPALPASPRFMETCLRYNPEHDGSLIPAVCRISMGYTPYAGQLVTKVLKPRNLKRWEKLTFDAEALGGATVTIDVLGENMVPAVTDDGTALVGVSNGVPLGRLDPSKYPALRVRIVMSKEGSLANQARLRWFKLEYEPMKEAIALNRNALRQGRGEGVEVRFMTKTAGMVGVRVYDGAGQLVRELFHGELGADEIFQQNWDGTGRDGRQVAPGVFFITVVTPDGSETLRLAVMR